MNELLLAPIPGAFGTEYVVGVLELKGLPADR